MIRTLAALVLAAPLATLGQYDPQMTPPEPAPAPSPASPPSTWGAAPAPQPSPPAHRPGHLRDTWYIGFGLGGGSGTARDHFSGNSSNAFRDYVGSDPTQLTLNFQVGATLSPRLLLGLDVGGLGAISNSNSVTSQFQVNTYDVAATWFPMDSGFFVKGGTGVSALTWDIEGIGTDRARGFNVMGGVGYAFWLGRTFNLTLNLEMAQSWFGGDEFKSARTTDLYLGFMWY